MEALIKSTVYSEIKEKDLRTIKKKSSKHHMKNIENFFSENMNKIIKNSKIPNDKRTTLL